VYVNAFGGSKNKTLVVIEIIVLFVLNPGVVVVCLERATIKKLVRITVTRVYCQRVLCGRYLRKQKQVPRCRHTQALKTFKFSTFASHVDEYSLSRPAPH